MNPLKNKLSTAILSDTLDEEGFHNQMLPIEIKPNFQEAKIFGKARTLTLKNLKEGEDYTEVYKGLYFLETIAEGEIIVVASGFRDLAFFGELMSTLSQRNKLEGAIIHGCTRDKNQTINMKFPVFAKDNYAKDIKKRGIVDKLDTEIEVGGVKIRKGDFLFGDLDGIIVIPWEIKDKIIKKALLTSEKERQIKKSIKSGLSIDEIIKIFGKF